MKRCLVLVFFLMVLCSLPGSVSGQVFPFDRVMNEPFEMTDNLRIVQFYEHLPFFGADTVTLEVYFEPIKEVPTKGGWAISLQCIETLFVQALEVSGQIVYPVAQPGIYSFITHKDGCYINQYNEVLPSPHAPSRGTELWGNCKPAEKKKTVTRI